MTKRYTGGVVSSAVPTANSAGASGVFLLSQQADYQAKNNWPPFKVEKSLRFRANSSTNLSRTVSTSGNRQQWTWSGWVKVGGETSGSRPLFGMGTSGTNYARIGFYGNYFWVLDYPGTTAFDLSTNTYQFFRDPSAWYHIVVAVDTTQATNTNRVKIYVNGTQIPTSALSSPTWPTQNYNTLFNSNVAHYHGLVSQDYSTGFDGYMCEVNFIDGQALTPSSFGGTDKDGNWTPIAYTGIYGQNGFYLSFKDATSTSTIGYDYSGNGNNWSATGFNLTTANTTYDSTIDVPSDQAGANTTLHRGNYCTLNSVIKGEGSIGTEFTIINGNLTYVATAGEMWVGGAGTIGVSSGKWYYECVYTQIDGGAVPGWTMTQTPRHVGTGAYGAAGDDTGIGFGSDGSVYTQGAATSKTNSGFTTNDILGLAIDIDARTMTLYKNGSSIGGAATINTGTYWPGVSGYRNFKVSANFGQRPFTYTPPAGYLPLNTYNLPVPAIPKPNKHFDINLWTGTGATQSITNSGQFQPDFVWIKGRSNATYHMLTNSVTGSTRYLYSNDTIVEGTWTDQLTSFNSNGFTLGADTNGTTNYSGRTFVGWQWNAGGANTTNTSGSVTSIVRANPTAGFSIVSFTKSSASVTVGHGLSTAPSMIILADRTGVQPKTVYHKSLGENWALYLNATNRGSGPSSPTFWNNTAPTSSVFSVGSYMTTGDPHMAYCWSEIDGYSKFGSYTGNGSTDGPFIYTGFRPRFIMVKRTDASSAGYDWFIFDTARDTYNVCTLELEANLSNVENDYSSTTFDLVSNGFKVRNLGTGINASGGTYIYMAFAEVPFKYSRSR
jgi:hypothetical protein